MTKASDAGNPVLGVGIVVEREGSYLLGLRLGVLGRGTWGFPGGHVEPGEDPVDCAKRELLEETGLDLLHLREAGWSSHADGGCRFVSLYVCVQAEGEASVREPMKCKEWRWFRPHELPSPLFGPTAEYFVRLGLGENCLRAPVGSAK